MNDKTNTVDVSGNTPSENGNKDYDPGEFFIVGDKLLKFKGKGESAEIPAFVTKVAPEAFQSANGLKSITIPPSVKQFGNSAFLGCNGLERVNYLGTLEQWCAIDFDGLGANPLYYGQHKLYIGGKHVEEIEIPKSVKEIKCDCFCGADLKSVYIPASVARIGADAFYGCNSVTVYCEASSKPEGWSTYWADTNGDNKIHVIWNV